MNTRDEFSRPPRTAKRIPAAKQNWRRKIHEVIFEADTFSGKLFDVGLLIAIVCSIAAISIETLQGVTETQLFWLNTVEWCFTILFTIEYVLRMICVEKPRKYATSFYGFVDFISILPTYLQILVPGTSSFAVVRSFRLLRVFRVMKLVSLLGESEDLYRAFWRARGKIVVFVATVLVTVTITGTMMYAVENPTGKKTEEETGFTSIPQSMYWAIVTMTTVGYGDVVPQTSAGKFLSAAVILMGYSLIIVPTGFVSAELISKSHKPVTTRTCPHCITEGHDHDATYCKYCSADLAHYSADAKST